MRTPSSRLAALCLLLPSLAGSESLTMTTTYPAPSGIYNQIVTTGDGGRDTILARDGGKVVLAPATNANGAVVIGTEDPAGARFAVKGDSRFTGDSTVTGKTTTQRLNIAGRDFPDPPSGTVLYTWAQIQLVSGTEADSSTPLGPSYTGGAHADTCNGSSVAAYTCTNGESRSCVDVQQVGTSGSPNNNSTYTLCSPNCPDDTCDGNKDNGFSCPGGQTVSCIDVKKMGGVRYRSNWYCYAQTPVYRDFAVTCNSATPRTMKVLVAE